MLKVGPSFAFTALAAFTGCAGSSNFGGSSATPASPQTPLASSDVEKAQSTASEMNAAASAPDISTSAEVAPATPPPMPIAPAPAQVPAPAGAQDISKSGFQCGPELTTATGSWSGTYAGSAVGLIQVSGNLTFDFTASDTQSLATKNFLIFGSLFGHDFVKSSTISFELKCGDLQLPDSLTPHGIVTIRRSFKLLSQSWNPPAFSGTWKTTLEGTGIDVAGGSFSISKVAAP